MASDNDATAPDEHRIGSDSSPPEKPPPPSWPRSLAPLAVIFAFSLALVLAILVLT